MRRRARDRPAREDALVEPEVRYAKSGRGSGIEFEERGGAVQLKGISGDWRLFEL